MSKNESVVNSATQPYDAKLHKQHKALLFHRVWEEIASGVFLVFTHIPGENNPANILSKHWGYSSVWHRMLRTIMFIDGETVDAPGRNDRIDAANTVSANTVTYWASQCIMMH